MTAYGQDTVRCLSRKQIDVDNQAYCDAITYRLMSDSLQDDLDSADALIYDQRTVIIQAQKTFDAKDETAAFYKSQAEMREKENWWLEKRDKAKSVILGLAVAFGLYEAVRKPGY